jgi:hypothetical protein
MPTRRSLVLPLSKLDIHLYLIYLTTFR